MGILFGLSAAFSWGIGDFFATTVSRRLGSARALMLTQSVSFSLAVLLVLMQGALPQAPASMWWLAFSLGALNFVATQLLYRAFQVGTLSLVSPLASSYTVITALLALASGERLKLIVLFGVLLLLLGVTFASQNPKDASPTEAPGSQRTSNAGLLEAGIAALCFGIVFWGIDYVTPRLGMFVPVLMLRLVTLTGSTTIWHVWVKHRQLAQLNDSMPTTGTAKSAFLLWGTIGLVACCDTAAWLSVIAGIRTEYTTIVTALSSLFSGVTVLLARLFLKEELAKIQWVGVAVILLGILLVSIR